MINTNVRAKSFCFIVYDESVNVVNLIKKLNNYCDYIYILHDKDISEDGCVKKPHYHFIIKFNNARWLSSISKDLDIAPNYFEPCRNVKSAMQYLIHFNDIDKFQYSKDDVRGNLISLFNKYINDDDIDEVTGISNIFDYIDSCGILSVTELSRYCVSNGLWSFYRRSFSIVYNYLIEHNNKIF